MTKKTFFLLVAILLLTAFDLYGQGGVTIRRRNLVSAGDATTLKTGLLAYWELEEADGATSLRDTSGNGKHLSINAGTYVSEETIKKLGSASGGVFTDNWGTGGTDTSFLRLGNVDFTISLWAYSPTSVPLEYQGLMARDISGAREFALALLNDKSCVFQLCTGDDAGGCSSVTSDTVFAPDRWFHVVAWYSSSLVRAYIQINGGGIDSANISPTPGAGPSKFQLGAFGDYYYPYTGYIDAAGIWSKVLTAAERALLFGSGSGKAYGTW